jgi:hypothetical protein
MGLMDQAFNYLQASVMGEDDYGYTGTDGKSIYDATKVKVILYNYNI